MSEMSDIKKLNKLLKIKTVFQHLNQLTWNTTQLSKRYPEVEAMTPQEMELLFKSYLAFGLDLEELYLEWKKLYDEEKSIES